MNSERSRVGHEIEAALGEVLAHVRGEVELPCRVIDDPSAERIRALRKRLKLSRERFAERFGLDARAVQDWEQGRRVPDRAARVLLTVIDREPEAVIRALSAYGGRPRRKNVSRKRSRDAQSVGSDGIGPSVRHRRCCCSRTCAPGPQAVIPGRTISARGTVIGYGRGGEIMRQVSMRREVGFRPCTKSPIGRQRFSCR